MKNLYTEQNFFYLLCEFCQDGLDLNNGYSVDSETYDENILRFYDTNVYDECNTCEPMFWINEDDTEQIEQLYKLFKEKKGSEIKTLRAYTDDLY